MADDSEFCYPFWQFGAFLTSAGTVLTAMGGYGINHFNSVSYEGFYWEPYRSIVIGVIMLVMGLFALGLAAKSPFTCQTETDKIFVHGA